MTKTDVNFHNPIAETLLIPLYAKAAESREPNPIIYDQSAIDIVASLSSDLSKFNDKKTMVGTAIRVRYFDDKVRDFIKSHDKAVVVNVGCGLDDRAGRIGKDGEKTPFYQVDIDEVIKTRQALMSARSNETLMVGSILAVDWLDELANKHPDAAFIFVIEGVLMYFDEKDNRQFLQAIAERFFGAVICFDMASEVMARHSHLHPTVRKTSAHFKCGINKPSDITAWHDKLQLVESKSFGEFDDNRRVSKIYELIMRYVPMFGQSFWLLTCRVD